MEYNYLLKKHKLDSSKLIPYGFINDKNDYTLKKSLNDSLYAVFTINEKKFNVEVYDKFDDSIYLPFNVTNATGSYIATIKEQVDKIKDDIIASCFEKNTTKEEVFKYFKEKYNSEPSYLWEKDEVTCVFKNEKDKWFSIYMEIPYKKLEINNDDIASIINLKNTPDKIDELIDNKNYFRAYHMNKKHWFTISLDSNSNLEEIKSLIDESYNLINK